MVAGEGDANHVLIGIVQIRLVETHARRQPTEELGIRHRLSHRLDCRKVERQVLVAPRPVNIHLLKLCRRWQHVVGVQGCIGQELLMHHREKVVAKQPLLDQILVRCDGSRIAAVHDHRLDRRIEVRVGEGASKLRHVYRPYSTVLQLRHLDGLCVQRLKVEARHHVKQPATYVAPRADQRRQARDCAQGHRSVGVMLHADQRANR